jgi:hypothetical protein
MSATVTDPHRRPTQGDTSWELVGWEDLYCD